MKRNFSIFRNSLLFIFTLSLITSSLIAFPAITKKETAEADEISTDPRIAAAPVLFNAKTSHSDMGDTPEPKIIVEFNKEYMSNKSEYDNHEIVLYNIRTGVFQDSTYRWDKNKVELDISKFAGQGLNLYQVYLIDYLDNESLSSADNIFGKSNIIIFERKIPSQLISGLNHGKTMLDSIMPNTL